MPTHSYMATMAGPANLVQGRGYAQILLPNSILIDVIHALYAPRGNKTLLSLKDIRANKYHAEKSFDMSSLIPTHIGFTTTDWDIPDVI